MNSISIKSPNQVKTTVSIVSLQFKCVMQRKSIRLIDEISYKMVIFRPLENALFLKFAATNTNRGHVSMNFGAKIFTPSKDTTSFLL